MCILNFIRDILESFNRSNLHMLDKRQEKMSHIRLLTVHFLFYCIDPFKDI